MCTAGNVKAVMGRTNCEKTYFVQRPVLRNIFGKLVQAEWVSQISLSKKRKAEVQSCFNCSLEFHYSENITKFDSLLEEFKLKTGKVDDNDTAFTDSYEEYIKPVCLIDTDNVSGLAEKSNDFASFLNVSRKFEYNCVYIFHINFPKKSIWKLIISQTDISNIFLGSVQQCNVCKILQGTA